MIETVYNNESGEINRTGKIQPIFKMPKNIRQVGKSNAARKIYVEDYVMTFIKQLTGEDYSNYKVAVLVGQNIKQEGGRSLFIYGAVEVMNLDVEGEINFSNDSWTSIYENIKKYFVDAEILGWFLGGPGYLLEDKDKILKVHIDNFAGQDKTLLTFDNMEKEEAFHFYENNRLVKQEGYYIYYDKNEEMQIYMIDHNKPESIEAEYDDRVSREIRTVFQNKKPSIQDNKSVNRLMYTAGALLAVIVLVVGAAMLSNYDQMKNMQKAMDSLSLNLEQTKANLGGEGDKLLTKLNDTLVSDKEASSSEQVNESTDSLDVNIVSGDLQPLEEEDNRPNSSGELIEKDKETPSNKGAEQKPDKPKEKDTDKSTEKATEKATESVKQEEVKYYTVVSGDSLAGISYRLYNSANYISIIKKLNNIEDENMIYIGQKLIIP